MLNFKFKLLNLFIIALCTGGMFISSAAFAAKPEIILFYADWHAKTKEAKSLCNKAADDFNIKIQELDIDNSKNAQKAKKLDIKIPSSIPYIYILDHKGKIVYQKPYKDASLNKIKQELQKYID